MNMGDQGPGHRPTVSVVVPTFNNAPFVEATIESVLAQTFTDFELIISDHASVDGTWDLIQKYAADPRVHMFQTEAGGGAVRNWTAVTAAASGRYLKLLCGDDLIYPDCLELQVSALEAHPSAVLATVKRDIIDVQGATLVAARGLGPLTGLVDGPTAIRALIRAGANLFGEPGCVLLRTDEFKAGGGWHNNFPYLIDQFSYMLLLEHGDMVGIDRSEAAFRLNNGQWSMRLVADQGKQMSDVARFFESEFPEIITDRDRWHGTRRAYITAYLRRIAYILWRNRMRLPARQALSPKELTR